MHHNENYMTTIEYVKCKNVLDVHLLDSVRNLVSSNIVANGSTKVYRFLVDGATWALQGRICK